MSTSTIGLPDALRDYLLASMVREPEGLKHLREDADRTFAAEAMMRMSAEQGSLMSMLVRIHGARRCLEVGTFVGYGTAAMASALPAGGRIVTCEIEPRFAAFARGNWDRMELAERIDLRLGPALETLDALLAKEDEGLFDLAFIDADKERYPLYFERCRRLVRKGGLILVDNVFWGGAVADPGKDDAETRAIREVTRTIAADPALVSATIPISDGLTIVRNPD